MILDGIVGTTGQELGNMSPLITGTIAMALKDDTIFLFSPGCLADTGVEVIMPAFTTLFSNTTCLVIKADTMNNNW
jgi:hypothetical protein